MNNIDIFTRKAEMYSKYRQGYSKEFVEYLYSCIDISMGSHIADIGSGTGIFSKLLLDKGNKVYCIEPNQSMRLVAEASLSQCEGFMSINSIGESTLLPPCSVDYITVAQAFHWLNAELFKAECKRIMKKGGKVIVIYNRKTKDAEVNIKLAELIKKHYPDYKDIINHWELRENSIKKFFDNVFEFVVYENNIVNNLQEFIGRTLSHSFSQNNEDFVNDLKEIFTAFSKNNSIIVPNDTIAYIGTI